MRFDVAKFLTRPLMPPLPLPVLSLPAVPA